MLENTTQRDQSQVVSRWAQNSDSKVRHNILMVDQLWLWGSIVPPKGVQTMQHPNIKTVEPKPKRHHGHVISSFPSRIGTSRTSHQTYGDLRMQILDSSDRKRSPIYSPAGLVSRILETCCGIFDRLRDVEELRFFQMFENAVGSLVSCSTMLLSLVLMILG